MKISEGQGEQDMGNKKSTRELVQDKMSDMLSARNNELNELKQRENDAASRIRIAEKDMENATRSTDLAAYSEAKERKASAENEVEMFKARYRQLHSSDFITEDESDKVIRSLLDYEKELERSYCEAIKTALENISKIHAEYREEVKQTEQTIKDWTKNIHPNYIKDGGMRALPDGTYTNRMETPQPVRRSEYLGCNVSFTINRLFDERNIKELFEAE